MKSREDASAVAGADSALRREYETLRVLLRDNGTALQLMADLEADLSHLGPTDSTVRRRIQELTDEARLMVQELNLLAGNRHEKLYGVIDTISARIRNTIAALPRAEAGPIVVRMDEAAAAQAKLAGGKAASVAALKQVLPEFVPPGFVVTTGAYRRFILENDLAGRIRELLADLDVLTDHPRFRERTEAIRELIRTAPLPPAVSEAIAREAAATAAPHGWAVRSSAGSEGEGLSFAGQFDSRLNVGVDDLVDAYRAVLVSRFSDRAVTYRLHFGFREVDTPMAVLFMPMIAPRAAGVISSRDPQAATARGMVLCAVPGLADRMMRGEEVGEIHRVELGRDAVVDSPVTTTATANTAAAGPDTAAPRVLAPADVTRIASLTADAVDVLGHELELEWALDADDRPWLLQARRLTATEGGGPGAERADAADPPLLEHGYTLFPGRAEGRVERLAAGEARELARPAPVLVVDRATPALVSVLPRVAALLIGAGNPIGHVTALVHEFRVPAISGLGLGAELLPDGQVVSVDATRHRVYRGSRWPGTRERVLDRLAAVAERAPASPLHELVLHLNLTDAHHASFKAGSCRSLHDVVRFVHEMAVRSLFGFGDRRNRFWKRSVKQLDSPLPLKLRVLDLDGCTPSGRTKLNPAEVASRPFQALFRGATDPRLTWKRKWIPDLANLPAGFVEQVFGGTRGPRRPGDANYAVVAADYLNLNARFVFHYAMLDAIVGDDAQQNHVHFRFRGGGASGQRRIRRARFLEIVLRSFHFGVDRRRDLVTAWLRNQPVAESERCLEMLGHLMACARQLDMALVANADVERYAESFLAENFAAFE